MSRLEVDELRGGGIGGSYQPGVYVPLKVLFLFFFIFAPKLRLWVLVRTTTARRLKRVPTIYVLSKNKRNIKRFLLKFFKFYSLR